MLRSLTIPERIVAIETDAAAEKKTNGDFRTDVEARLRRMEKILWGMVALQLGLKYLL